jgi:hypothetical protein
METSLHLTRLSPDDPKLSRLDVDRLAQTLYRSLVGGLMYLALRMQADIAFAVNHLSSFLDCYGFKHWHTAILRYLKGTRTLALILSRRKDIFLTGHSDTDFANDLDRRKSVMGYTFSIGSGAISWAS